ncbi:MAG: hypothetical protein ACETV1_04595, partial [Candidatus Bathyarchaeia archaeon]
TLEHLQDFWQSIDDNSRIFGDLFNSFACTSDVDYCDWTIFSASLLVEIPDHARDHAIHPC